MKTITKHTILALLATTAMFASCYEDKGNYTYTEMEEITGDGFPDHRGFGGDGSRICGA